MFDCYFIVDMNFNYKIVVNTVVDCRRKKKINKCNFLDNYISLITRFDSPIFFWNFWILVFVGLAINQLVDYSKWTIAIDQARSQLLVAIHQNNIIFLQKNIVVILYTTLAGHVAGDNQWLHYIHLGILECDDCQDYLPKVSMASSMWLTLFATSKCVMS